jgi:signal transduction histidine kinase
MKRSLAFAIMIMLVTSMPFAPAASAGDLVVSRAYLEDPDGRWSVDEVKDMSFQPMGLALAAGFTDSVHWVRVQIKAPVSLREVVLRITPTYLDEVRLFEPAPERPNFWNIRVSGDRYPFLSRDRAATYLGFVVPAVAEGESTYYLRLKTTSTSMLIVEALSLPEAQSRDNLADFAQALFLGLNLAFLLWTAFNHAAHGDRVSIWFMVHQIAYMAVSVAVTGYLAPFVSVDMPQLADWATSVLICVMVAVIALFNHALLKQYRPNGVAMGLLRGVAWLLPLELVMMVLGFARQALQLNSLALLLMAPLLLYLAWSATHDAVPGRRVLRWVYVVQALILGLSRAAPLFGVFPELNAWALNPSVVFLINGLVASSLMFMILHMRERNFRSLARANALALAELNVQMAQLMDRSESAVRTKGAILARVSHELRTPLNHMLGAAQLLRGGDISDAERTEFLGMIENAGTKLRKSVDDLLMLAEGGEAAPADKDMEFRLRDILGGTVSSLRPAASAKGLRLELEIDPQVPLGVWGDATRLNRTLLCLVDNAIKFTERGAVMVSVTLEETLQAGDACLIRVEVRDTGRGFDPAAIQGLFEGFEQEEDFVTRSKGGMGLGLAIARQSIFALGGRIGASANEDAGSTFWFTARFDVPASGAAGGAA